MLRGVSLDVAGGELLTLLGPSGCGKTTLLRVIAGLERPEVGRVATGDRVLADRSTFVTPDKRGIGLVFQDGALFPHLDVGSNVAYGLNRLPKSERRVRVAEALELIGLSGLEARSPSTLSGGQQQRVALARALAPQPEVLLLDEPFSNLDASLRGQLRTELHALLVRLGITTVFVTHDQEEAFVLGDRVAVLRDGEIVQVASPADIYLRPADPWVARFVGVANMVAGHASGLTAQTPLGVVPLAETADGARELLVRPEWLTLDGPDAGGDAVPGTVELVEFRGSDTSYQVSVGTSGSPGDGPSPVIEVLQPGAPGFARGDRVAVRYAGPPTTAFPAPSPPDELAGSSPPQG